MSARLKVAVVLAVLFGGVILVALLGGRAHADVAPPITSVAVEPPVFVVGVVEAAPILVADALAPATDPDGLTFPALLGLALLAVFALAWLVFGLLQRKWRRVEADMDALIEATHECAPGGPCAWCVSKAPAVTPEWVAAQDLDEIEASWALPLADEPRRRTP